MSRIMLNGREVSMPQAAVDAMDADQLYRAKLFAESLIRNVDNHNEWKKHKAAAQEAGKESPASHRGVKDSLTGVVSDINALAECGSVLSSLHYLSFQWEPKT